MKITLSIDSKETIEIGHSDLANTLNWLDDEPRYAAFFSALLSHPASEVRCVVAGKTVLTVQALEMLVNDPSIEVVRQVANNERALSSFEISPILEMIRRDVSVAADIADNLDMVTNEEVREIAIQILLNHTDPKVADTAARFDSSR